MQFLDVDFGPHRLDTEGTGARISLFLLSGELWVPLRTWEIFRKGNNITRRQHIQNVVFRFLFMDFIFSNFVTQNKILKGSGLRLSPQSSPKKDGFSQGICIAWQTQKKMK